MNHDTHEPPRSLLIGPGLGPDVDQDGSLDPPNGEGRRLALRLVLAFFLIVGITIMCFVLAPIVGIPPWVPLAAFAVMTVSVLLHAGSEGQQGPRPDPDERAGCGGDGRPVGCCPGPRPPSFLREPPRR